MQFFEGALNYERFALYVSRFLAPMLRPDDVLLLNNLAVHKIGGQREWLAERGGTRLISAPHSPDFSGLEQTWSRLKTAARTDTSPESKSGVGGRGLNYQPKHQYWFGQCGYDVQVA